MSAHAVVELRQYTLHPGRRDELIELFDREFVETQEAAGMRVLGQFRDLDRPDHFVWLRSFPDLAARTEALAAFYGGPVWAAHRDAANATMIDSDDVLMLRPAPPSGGFAVAGDRPPVGATDLPPSLLVGAVLPLRDGDTEFPGYFGDAVLPALVAAGVRPIATFETEPGPNGFPALPVREGERVFVWFASLSSEAAWQPLGGALPGLPHDRLAGPPHLLRLRPTTRSLLR